MSENPSFLKKALSDYKQVAKMSSTQQLIINVENILNKSLLTTNICLLVT